MRFVFTRDIHEFAGRTEALFAARIECNILATITESVRHGRYADRDPLFAYGLDQRGEVRFGALRTPPWPMVASELERSKASEFTADWLAADPDLPGINGVPNTARAIAAAWCEQTGGTSRCRGHEAFHVLDRVDDPRRPAPGALRPPEPSEHELVIDWMSAFATEVGTLPIDEVPAMTRAALARGALSLWDDGRPVSMVGSSPPVGGVVRIGPVYTIPEFRRRGYATSMVAAASRRVLAADATRCMLFTDLANPTSNKIYAEVGYRRVGDWEEHVLERA